MEGRLMYYAADRALWEVIPNDQLGWDAVNRRTPSITLTSGTSIDELIEQIDDVTSP